MITLPNVHTPRGRALPPDAGFASCAYPRNEKLLEGVSVRYVPDPRKQWFVLRVTYNRQDKAYEYIVNDHTEAYMPLHYTLRECDGRKKRVLEPLLPNLLFVYATPQRVESYVKCTPQLSFVNYYYDHFHTENGKNLPLTIPYDVMMNFIRVSSVGNEHVRVVEEAHCHFKSGDSVRVTKGEFEGVRGRVARVSGQQRVVVSLDGLCLVATAYIPSDFIEKTND